MCGKSRRSAISLLLIYTVLSIIISGCSAGGGNAVLLFSRSATSNPTTLAWDAPITYADGTTIEPGAITGYRISLYTDAALTAKYEDYLISGPNPATSINLTDLNNALFTDEMSRGASTTYYLVVTAIVTVDGIEIESAPSNPVSYTYPTTVK